MKLFNEIIDLMLEKASYNELFLVDNKTELFTEDLTLLGKEMYKSVLEENKIKEYDPLTYRLPISRERLVAFCKNKGFYLPDSKVTEVIIDELKQYGFVNHFEEEADTLYINQLTKKGYRRYLEFSSFTKPLEKKEEVQKMKIFEEQLTVGDLYDLCESAGMEYSVKWSIQTLISEMIQNNLLPSYSETPDLDDYKVKDVFYSSLQKKTKACDQPDPIVFPLLFGMNAAISKLSEKFKSFSSEERKNMIIERLNFKTEKPDEEDKEQITGVANVKILNCKVVINKQFGDCIFKEESETTGEVSLTYEYNHLNDDWLLSNCYIL